jgi:hypothetical protein
MSANGFEPGMYQILVTIDTTKSVLHVDALVASESLKDVGKMEASVRSFVYL